ncbi:hypothetical protein HKD37_04G009546 [Glycine soja]
MRGESEVNERGGGAKKGKRQEVGGEGLRPDLYWGWGVGSFWSATTTREVSFTTGLLQFGMRQCDISR